MSKKSVITKTFFPEREPLSIIPLGFGRINETWLVEFVEGTPRKAVLQKLNNLVFKDPALIMCNLRSLADHLHRKSGHGRLDDYWRVVSPYMTPEESDHYIDDKNDFWRMLTYIDNAICYQEITTEDQAREAGIALGRFHRLTSDLSPDCLHDPLPGFHVTPEYLCKYDRVIEDYDSRFELAEEKLCAEFVEKNRDGVNLLEEACEKGLVKKRVIHGDPKVSNIMFDSKTGKAVSIVDLDTVKPGLLHYDLGDCFRSSCNPAGGDGDHPEQVQFETTTFSAVLNGYIQEMSGYLNDEDYNLIFPAINLISFELGLRYFTDHLQGDIYFKTDFQGQNLKRALGQFLLAEDIQKKEAEIMGIINSCRSKQ